MGDDSRWIILLSSLVIVVLSRFDRRALNMFSSLWPRPLNLWPQYHSICRLSQVHSLHQVCTLWDHSFLSYHADKQTNKQTDNHTKTVTHGWSPHTRDYRRRERLEINQQHRVITNPALATSSSAKCCFPADFASSAISVNIKLATNAEPIWSGHSFQKIDASCFRRKNTAQTNSSRCGCNCSTFSITHQNLQFSVSAVKTSENPP